VVNKWTGVRATRNCRYVQFPSYPGRVFVQATRMNPGSDEQFIYYGDAWSAEELLVQVVRPRR
jgi:hypothetical protein